MQATDVLIIGAGISGLLCATELRKAGKSVRVLDKGRGIGGRMATRRMAGGRFDHGAQFFTVRDPRMDAYAAQWLKAGVIKEWFRHSPEDSNPAGYPRYCGSRGMTDVPEYLAKDLDVQTSQQVVELVRDIEYWLVRTEAGDAFIGKHLIITAPLPQALNLLDMTGLRYANGHADTLREVRYERCLAILAILDGPSGIIGSGGKKVYEAPIAWIGDNQQKGISPNVSAITIHADAEFSEQHWGSPDKVRGSLMIEAAAQHFHASVVEYHCHRWGFTKPINPWPEPYFQNAALNLTLAGDSFGGARIEGAALSGIEAAKAVLLT